MSRDVVFRLTSAVDPKAKQVIDRYADSLDKAVKRVDMNVKKSQKSTMEWTGKTKTRIDDLKKSIVSLSREGTAAMNKLNQATVRVEKSLYRARKASKGFNFPGGGGGAGGGGGTVIIPGGGSGRRGRRSRASMGFTGAAKGLGFLGMPGDFSGGGDEGGGGGFLGGIDPVELFAYVELLKSARESMRNFPQASRALRSGGGRLLRNAGWGLGRRAFSTGIGRAAVRGIGGIGSRMALGTLGAGSLGALGLGAAGVGAAAFGLAEGGMELFGGGGSIRAGIGAFQSSRRTAALEQKTMQDIERRAELDERIAAAGMERLRMLNKQRSIELSLRDIKMESLTTEEKLKRTARDLNAEKERQKRLSKAADENMITGLDDALMKRAEQSAERVFELARERVQLEQRVVQERLAAEQKIITRQREGLRVVKERIASEKEAFQETVRANRAEMAAKQQEFGSMSLADQNRMIDLVMQARRNPRSLSAGDLTSLEALGTDEASRIVQRERMRRGSAQFGSGRAQQQMMRLHNEEIRLRGRMTQIRAQANPFYINVDTAGVPDPSGKKHFSMAERQEMDAIERRLRQIVMQKTAVSDREAERQAIRRSIFAEDRRNNAVENDQALNRVRQLQNRRRQIEAKIGQRIEVAVNLEKTARQLSDEAVKKILEATAPVMENLRRELGDVSGRVDVLMRQRMQGLN